MTFEVLRDKVVQIEYNGVKKIFEFKIKRAFTVFINILEVYPEYMDIHSLDGVLNDPNRAVSDLKNGDGYEHFIIERRNSKRNLEYIIEFDKLFEAFKDYKEVCLSSAIRVGPSNDLKKYLQKKYSNKCNITGIPLHQTLSSKTFLKNLQMIQYDHRVPLFKGGDENPNSPENWQLLSELVNREKNKLCNSCSSNECKLCALAFPEKSYIIKANGQSIKDIIDNLKQT
jgi:hypothetical protein